MDPTVGTKHISISWTVCYDDNSKVHESEKDGARWYPQESRPRVPRLQKSTATTLADAQAIQPIADTNTGKHNIPHVTESFVRSSVRVEKVFKNNFRETT